MQYIRGVCPYYRMVQNIDSHDLLCELMPIVGRFILQCINGPNLQAGLPRFQSAKWLLGFKGYHILATAGGHFKFDATAAHLDSSASWYYVGLTSYIMTCVIAASLHDDSAGVWDRISH